MGVPSPQRFCYLVVNGGSASELWVFMFSMKWGAKAHEKLHQHLEIGELLAFQGGQTMQKLGFKV